MYYRTNIGALPPTIQSLKVRIILTAICCIYVCYGTSHPLVKAKNASGKIIFPSGKVVFPLGKVVFPSGNVILPSGNVILPSGNVILPSGNVILPSGKVILPSGKVILPSGKVILPSGKIILPLGKIEKSQVRMLFPSGISHITYSSAMPLCRGSPFTGNRTINSFSSHFLNLITH